MRVLRTRGGFPPLRASLVLAGALGVGAFLVTATGAALAAGDAAHGEKLYEGCQDCHSLDKNDVGPRHRGVFGREAGSLADYNYSPALKASNFIWEETTLDRWLTNPQAFVPGAKMFYHLANSKDRADVIEFLKTEAK